jgi:hypothetical protein
MNQMYKQIIGEIKMLDKIIKWFKEMKEFKITKKERINLIFWITKDKYKNKRNLMLPMNHSNINIKIDNKESQW